MKLTRGSRYIYWLIVIAYAALLTHAFIPHHHHGEHVAYLNHMSCPHDHHTPDHTEHAQHTVDCETLKNILLNESQSPLPDLMANLGPFTETELFPSLLHMLSGLPISTNHFRYSPLPFTGLPQDSLDLRGPPMFS